MRPFAAAVGTRFIPKVLIAKYPWRLIGRKQPDFSVWISLKDFIEQDVGFHEQALSFELSILLLLLLRSMDSFNTRLEGVHHYLLCCVGPLGATLLKRLLKAPKLGLCV
jgi:hypothetical protein